MAFSMIYRITGTVLSWLALWTLLLPSVKAQSLQVRHEHADSRDTYFVELLELVLQQTEAAYELIPREKGMVAARAFRQLSQGRDIDIVWSMTTSYRENEPNVYAIRVPLTQGLFGLRVLLINAADSAQFAQVELDELKTLAAGQGHDWADTAILRSNGFSVETSTSYASLFRMLHYGRFAYMPRSVLEVWDEVATHTDKDLVIAPKWLLAYPAPIYFFVHEQNTELIRRLEEGLALAIADGSFEAHFQQWFGEYVKRSGLHARQVVHLSNPLIPADSTLNIHRRWFNLP